MVSCINLESEGIILLYFLVQIVLAKQETSRLALEFGKLDGRFKIHFVKPFTKKNLTLQTP